MREKLKSIITDERSLFGLLVVLVGVASFFLGRASLTAEQRAVGAPSSRVTITQQEESLVQQSDSPQLMANERVIASRSGSRYHRPDCPGANQIKPENRIEFESVQAAKAAGYTPASNCPGLE